MIQFQPYFSPVYIPQVIQRRTCPEQHLNTCPRCRPFDQPAEVKNKHGLCFGNAHLGIGHIAYNGHNENQNEGFFHNPNQLRVMQYNKSL
jgi:hypothetical protein